jgi:PST family polysaccharide transporter
MGMAALFQPVMSTGGWLLVSQGRVREMLRWSLINAPISILSIAAGLPWGVAGVAASWALGRIFVANPLLFWFVGRKGPVRTRDFYRMLAPFTLASVVSFGACLAFRRFVVITNPVLGVAACAVLVGLTTLLVLALLPAGRKALADIKSSLTLLRPERASVES